MVAITNIGGTAQAAVKEAPPNRPRKGELTASPPRDGVKISTEAIGTAETQRLAKQGEEQAEVRQALVDEARQRIREGDHQMQEIVRMVAASISGYL